MTTDYVGRNSSENIYIIKSELKYNKIDPSLKHMDNSDSNKRS